MTTSSTTEITTLQGDRLCISCRFNLHGQPVVREPVYGMVLVRCPECGTPASLQEYPLLGRWPGRIAAALAAVWLLILLAGGFASAGISFGLTEGLTQAGSTKVSKQISKSFGEWFAAADDKAKAAYTAFGGNASGAVNQYGYIDKAWWEGLDKRSLFSDAGGVRSLINHESAQFAVSTLLAGFGIGIVWSVALLGLPRKRLFIAAALIIAAALCFELIWGSLLHTDSTRWTGGILWSGAVASEIVAPYTVPLSLVIMFIGLSIGMWFGRPLARWLVRLLLPPRLASALSILWIAEGKPLPKPPKRPQPKAKPTAD